MNRERTDKAISMTALRPMGLVAPERLADVDNYEIYVRVTPLRYYDAMHFDGTPQKIEERGEPFGCVSYVAKVASKESGLLLHLIRQMLRQIVGGFFGVDL